MTIVDGTSINYQPAANFFGQETFTYTTNDGTPGNDDTATVTITVTPVNDRPTAADDSFNVSANSRGNVLDILGNDSILPDSGETLKILVVSSGSAGGTVLIVGGHQIDYSPSADFVGHETFVYAISDGNGGFDTATVRVTMRAEGGNNAPVANPDASTTDENNPVTVDVLANDTDVDSSDDPSNFSLDSVSIFSIGGLPGSQAALNVPADLKVGTDLPIIPVAGGPLIDSGTGDAITGLENLIGPFLGSAPDAGAHELGLGTAWTGPRDFTNLLAYGLPAGWSVAPLGELSNYQDFGAPASVGANDFRLLLVQDNPGDARAFLLVTFEQLAGNSRWSRYDDILDGDAGDTVQVGPVDFRDGLGGSLVSRGANVNLVGARVDDEGVLNVLGGVVPGQLGQVQDEMFTFIRSLYYAWNLQATSNPISITMAAAPAQGVVPAGTAAAANSGNSISAGIVSGDVTFTSASILWDVQGDADGDATSSLRFRRQGTTQWRDALDPARVIFGADNRIAGSIFGLAPGTTYEFEISLSDPDGGSGSETTTLTTRAIPKITNPGSVIEVLDTDDLNAVLATASPGDTLLFHAGTYTSATRFGINQNYDGTAANPILLRAFGDGDVNFYGIDVKADYIWIDGFKIGAGGINDDAFLPTGVILTGNTGTGASHSIDSDGTEWVVLDNTLVGHRTDLNCSGSECFEGEGIEFEGRGHVAAFNDISFTGDAISYGVGNIDVHNNRIHEITDDTIEPDYAWDNYRIWENLAWQVGGSAVSFQPINGGPWYVFKNQFTGVGRPWKAGGGSGSRFNVANTVFSTIPNQNFQRDGRARQCFCQQLVGR